MQELAHGLGELLSYEGNVEEDFYLTFQVQTINYFFFLSDKCYDATTHKAPNATVVRSVTHSRSMEAVVRVYDGADRQL